MSQNKKLVSVIVLADAAQLELINEQVTNVVNQTYRPLDILLSVAKGRNDLDKIRERWNIVPNLRIVESEPGLEVIKNPLTQVQGEYVFYKAIGPTSWLPRHIDHHVDLFKWDQKSEWSFSFLEFKNFLEQQNPVNVINWRIESNPQPQSIIIDELCHLADFKPDWDQFIVSMDGKSTTFFPGRCFEVWKQHRVAVPTEITVQMWVDPRPPQPQLGQPASDQNVNEEVIEGVDGQLQVKIELPTLMGSSQFEAHNKLVLNRLKEIPPENIKKIALKRTIGMGDVILVEPVIRSLRTKYPNAEITLFTSKERSCVDIVQAFVGKPDVVVGLEGEGDLVKDLLYTQKGYDLRIDFDLSYESRRDINYVDAYFLTAGFRDEVQEVDGKLTVASPIPESEKIPILAYEEPRMIADKYVTVEMTGSGWPGKEWSEKNWNTILVDLIFKGYKIAYVSNGKRGVGQENKTFINDKNDFNTMMNYLRYSEFHIGADNGPMHIAAALGKKCFIVAGAAIPSYTSKSPNIYQCLHSAMPCLHCKGRQFYNPVQGGGITFVARCENSDQYACMTKMEEQYVLGKFQDFYSKIGFQ